jgi:hypothetical protein
LRDFHAIGYAICQISVKLENMISEEVFYQGSRPEMMTITIVEKQATNDPPDLGQYYFRGKRLAVQSKMRHRGELLTEVLGGRGGYTAEKRPFQRKRFFAVPTLRD